MRSQRKSSETDRHRPRSRYQNEPQERGHRRNPSPRSRQKDRSSKERSSRREKSKPTSRRNSPTVSDGVERRSRDSVSPHFDFTRHNVRRACSRWQDAGASVHVQEWIRHGVSIPWLPGGPPPPFNNGMSCQRLPQDQDAFLKEEIARLAEKGVLRPIEYSRWVSSSCPRSPYHFGIRFSWRHCPFSSSSSFLLDPAAI